jgi:hypothetical protein
VLTEIVAEVGDTIVVRSVPAIIEPTCRKDRPPSGPLQRGPVLAHFEWLHAGCLIGHGMRQPVYSLLRGTSKNISGLLPESAVSVE